MIKSTISIELKQGQRKWREQRSRGNFCR